MIKLYSYKKCSTCRKAENYLKEQGLEYEYIPLIENPPSAEELKEMIEVSGKEYKNFFNTSGIQYREMGLKDKLPTMSDEEKLELLASSGKLIKRPIITDGTKVSLGFKGIEKVWP